MLKENERLPKPQMPGSNHVNGAETKPFVEKKGFKRAEAATYLGVTPVTIDRLTKRGLLHPSRALRHPIYSRDDLDRFLRETSEPFGQRG
ncbi:MAG: helix-turn-helix domain-containing protein [Limisphaerales bacterium]